MSPLPDTVKALLGIIASEFYQATGFVTFGVERKFQMNQIFGVSI
jgi:hypothetical protein